MLRGVYIVLNTSFQWQHFDDRFTLLQSNNHISRSSNRKFISTLILAARLHSFKNLEKFLISEYHIFTHSKKEI